MQHFAPLSSIWVTWRSSRFPGELFSTFGIEIKKHFHAPMRIVWGYANYSAGYIVEKMNMEKAMKAGRLHFRKEKQNFT